MGSGVCHAGPVSDEAPSVVAAKVMIEHVDPTLLGIDPENPSAPALMSWCATVLGAIALDPEQVTLLVTGDFVASVRSRSVTEEQREAYHTARNAGMVGAKTMPRPDGTIDVIAPAWWFLGADSDANGLEEREALARRTIVHEAFHVVMDQAGETQASFEGLSWARVNMLGIADSVLSEYRAEAAVNPELNAHVTAWKPLDILQHLRTALAEHAAVNYQAHLDVDRLSRDVGVECLHAWQLLAYVAAAHLQPDSTFAEVADDVAADLHWQTMVEPHWDRFTDLLSRVPPGDMRVERPAIDDLMAELADELTAWLLTWGFSFADGPEGSEFRVVHWNFVD